MGTDVMISIVSAIIAVSAMFGFEKSKFGKGIGFIFIIISLGLAISGRIDSNSEAEKANTKAIIASINYSKDTAKSNAKYIEDSLSNEIISKNYQLQIQSYKNQLLASESIDSIKKKTGSIIKNLDALYENVEIKTNELSHEVLRQAFSLDSNITAHIRFGITSKRLDSLLADYNMHNDDYFVSYDFPYLKMFDEYLKSNCISVNVLDEKSKTILFLKSEVTFHILPRNIYLGKEGYPWSFSNGDFTCEYLHSDKIYIFDCRKVSLKREFTDNNFLSILDFEGKSLSIQLMPLDIQSGWNILSLETTFINFDLNFSDKKHTLFYKGKMSGSTPTADINSIKFKD